MRYLFLSQLRIAARISSKNLNKGSFVHLFPCEVKFVGRTCVDFEESTRRRRPISCTVAVGVLALNDPHLPQAALEQGIKSQAERDSSCAIHLEFGVPV